MINETCLSAPLDPEMGLDIRVLRRGWYLDSRTEHTRKLVVHGRRRNVHHKMLDENHLHIWSDVHLGYTLEIVRTPCRYGGTRPWFMCPQCDRRCAIIYSPIENFVCRTCAGLHYTTPLMNAGDRAIERARKLKKRLGWTHGGILGGYGGKPVGMHWKTFERLQLEYRTAEFYILYDIAKAIGMKVIDHDPKGNPVSLPGTVQGRPRKAPSRIKW